MTRMRPCHAAFQTGQVQQDCQRSAALVRWMAMRGIRREKIETVPLDDRQITGYS
ncbi:MAG: hypothetical protein JWM30_836 [Burkholderia sp.]|nr:hypothetical protein [Burkholderia sp.]